MSDHGDHGKKLSGYVVRFSLALVMPLARAVRLI